MSERLEFKGDYMGFTYNNTHSSTLGIVRTSDGSRFNENLLPTIQDKTVQVPGGDGTYFFGSYYTQRQFSVSFAFDSLTEEQIAEIRRVFGDKQIHDLIFDERPYKVYSAKVTGTATIKYIAFDQGATNRLYKGEGTIQFTCYFPFARCRFTTREEYENIGCTNIDEWWNASRIENGGNFGDKPAPFTKNITDTSGSLPFGEIKWKNLPTDIYVKANTTEGFEQGKDYYKKEEDKYVSVIENAPVENVQYYTKGAIVLNTKTGLVKGEDGNIYNKYFTGNLTAKIPEGATAEETAGLEFTCLYI